MPDTYQPSPKWVTGVKVDQPVPQIRGREAALRHGKEYLAGTVWAIDANGLKAGYQSFEVIPDLRLVLLVQAGMERHDGDNGEDNCYQGGERAMLDELDRLYMEQEWWIASSNAGHEQAGIDLMRGRESRPGRRKVHTGQCAVERPAVCGCSFSDKIVQDWGDDEEKEGPLWGRSRLPRLRPTFGTVGHTEHLSPS